MDKLEVTDSGVGYRINGTLTVYRDGIDPITASVSAESDYDRRVILARISPPLEDSINREYVFEEIVDAIFYFRTAEPDWEAISDGRRCPNNWRGGRVTD